MIRNLHTIVLYGLSLLLGEIDTNLVVSRHCDDLVSSLTFQKLHFSITFSINIQQSPWCERELGDLKSREERYEPAK